MDDLTTFLARFLSLFLDLGFGFYLGFIFSLVIDFVTNCHVHFRLIYRHHKFYLSMFLNGYGTLEFIYRDCLLMVFQ